MGRGNNCVKIASDHFEIRYGQGVGDFEKQKPLENGVTEFM